MPPVRRGLTGSRVARSPGVIDLSAMRRLRRPSPFRALGFGTGRRAVLAALAALLVACGGSEPALRIDGVAFTEDELLGLTRERRARLAELTALGLAVARDEVERLGAPHVDRRRRALLLERFRAALALERSRVDDEVLRAQYETNPRHELVVRHVVALAEPEDPDSVHTAARDRAERALERIEAGEPFAQVAADLSQEPGAAQRGGRLEPGRRGSWVPGFWRAASRLEEGEHTGVVETRYGYHVIRLEERRIVPFEEVRSEVVLEAGRMLGGTEEAWGAWADSVARSVQADSEEARREAVRERALEEARSRGLRVPEAERERLVREWSDRARAWAAAFGFEPGASTEAVKEAALEALSTTRQNATIARRELEPHGPLLRSAYEVQGLAGNGPSDGGS